MLLLIIVLQGVYWFTDFSRERSIRIASNELIMFEKQRDSLRSLALEKKAFKIYPFNPNYIKEYKAYQLGMSSKEIGRLLSYREKGKFVNSEKEFQQVTRVSDTLLQKIAPYFKFPDWVIKKQQAQKKKLNVIVNDRVDAPKAADLRSTIDINKATVDDFQSIYGIGEVLSERIVKYRNKLQGFTYKDQLFEVWNLDKEVAQKILHTFKIIELPVIEKINVNTVTFKELLKVPYIDYNLCKKIFEYRDEVAELQDIAELKNIEGFPLEKYNRIVLYLLAQ